MGNLRQGTMVLMAVTLLLLPAFAGAVQIGLSTPSSLVSQGSVFEVNLTVSDLGDSSLSTFDLDVLFNPAVVGFSSVIYGDPVLGDQLDLFGLGNFQITNSYTGSVNLLELSFDSLIDLNSLQADAFILATLSFEALTPGTSLFNVSVNAFGDAEGKSLPFDQIAAASIEAAPVPEPSTFLLLGAGLAGCLLFRKRIRK